LELALWQYIFNPEPLFSTISPACKKKCGPETMYQINIYAHKNVLPLFKYKKFMLGQKLVAWNKISFRK